MTSTMIRTLILCAALAGCATTTGPLGQTPEAQIAQGALTVTAATTAATVALRNRAITVTTAKGYRLMLEAAGEALHEANTELEQCRTDTKSTAKTSPDPCWPKVQDVVTIALQSVASIRRAIPK